MNLKKQYNMKIGHAQTFKLIQFSLYLDVIHCDKDLT
jgi:hypothetical protein